MHSKGKLNNAMLLLPGGFVEAPMHRKMEVLKRWSRQFHKRKKNSNKAKQILLLKCPRLNTLNTCFMAANSAAALLCQKRNRCRWMNWLSPHLMSYPEDGNETRPAGLQAGAKVGTWDLIQAHTIQYWFSKQSCYSLTCFGGITNIIS